MRSNRGFGRLLKVWVSSVIDPRRAAGIAKLPRYLIHWHRYNRLGKAPRLRFRESHPCLTDWSVHTPFDPHYFYQSCWAARRLIKTRPAAHVDVGSSVLFVGMISGVVPTVFVDYRPLKASVKGLSAVAGNLASLPFADGSVPSLSCLHVIEHVGLGRYGDPLDASGSLKAAEELTRVLAPGGRLLLSVPVGVERIQFNAHRVFAPASVATMFGTLSVVDFCAVDDDGVYAERIDPGSVAECDYACGMWEFRKC